MVRVAVPVPITVTGFGEKLPTPEGRPEMLKVKITAPGKPPSSIVTVYVDADDCSTVCEFGVTVTVTPPTWA
jgi:hypothetical protein